MLEIGSRSEDLSDLFLCQDIGKSELLSGIEGMGYYIGRGQYVLEKEATALGRHPAFVPAYAVFLFDVVDVGGDVFLCKLLGIEMVVIGKNIAYFGHIVADGHW